MSQFIPGETVYASSRGEVHVGYVVGEPVMDYGEYWYLVRFCGGTFKFPEEELSKFDIDHSFVVADFSGYELKSGSFVNGIYKYVEGNDLKRHMRSSKQSLPELFDAKFFVQTDVSISLAEFLHKRR